MVNHKVTMKNSWEKLLQKSLEPVHLDTPRFYKNDAVYNPDKTNKTRQLRTGISLLWIEPDVFLLSVKYFRSVFRDCDPLSPNM